jgi:signal transduction histidine kinase
MSDSPPAGQRPEPVAPASAGEHSSPLTGVLAPLATMALLGIIVAVVLSMGPSTSLAIGAAVAGLLIAALIVAWAISSVRTAEHHHEDELRRLRQAVDQAHGAASAGRHHQSEVDRLRATLQRLYELSVQWPAQFVVDVERFATRVRDGERPVPHEVPAGYVDERDPFARLEYEHHTARHAAELAVLRAAQAGAADDPAQRLQVFANLGRRLQSLVNREIQMLDELEKQIEDPEVLEGIFAVDHLATRIRRQAENLCVLGGARAPRQWSKPLTMVTTLRSAMQEVEFYKRVKMVLPINGTLRGHNVTEIIHLLAELIENATAFSAPDTTVLLSAQVVTAGLAIEVEDRGLGVKAEDLERINGLLGGQFGDDVGVLLSEGRQIGLWVVAQLARRNDVRVRLSRNIFGGTTAAVVVPHTLLGEEPEREPAQPVEQAEPRHGMRSGYALPVPKPASLSDTQQFAVAVAEQPPALPAAAPSTPPRGIDPPSRPGLEPVADPHGWPAAPVEEHDPIPANASGDTVHDEQRPRLPKRQPGTNHLAPELQATPPGFDNTPGFFSQSLPAAAVAPAAAQNTEHGSASIAAFRSGIRAGSGSNNEEPTAQPDALERSSFLGEPTHHDR